MTSTLEKLKIWQLGKETTWKTGVTDTVKLMGIKSGKLDLVVDGEVFDVMTGSLQPGFDSDFAERSGKGEIETYVQAEDMVYWLESMTGVGSPTGAGPYVYTGAMPNTAEPTSPRIGTLYHGVGSHVYRLLGALVDEITIKGEKGKTMMAHVKFISGDYESSSLAALSDRTTNKMMGHHVAWFIDAVGGTMGGTAITASHWSFELKLKNKRALQPLMGSLTPQDWNENRWEAKDNSLKMKLKFNATTKAYLTSILTSAPLPLQVRMKATKSASAIVQFDFAGVTLKAPTPDTYHDGISVMELELHGQYNAALANSFKWSLTNGLSAMP